MRVLVTGVGGQLGYDVTKALISKEHEVIGSDIFTIPPKDYSALICGITDSGYVPLDITNESAVNDTILALQPDAIIHCAAWTAVDEAEKPENFGKVMDINGEGTARIAMAARRVGAKLIYISTDYVFDGTGDKPWDPDDPKYKPLNVYGRSKLSGEYGVSFAVNNFYIVRTAWVFGQNGNNFVKTMLRVGKTHKQLRVVNDQVGTPTYTFDLARLLVDMVETEKYGYYHATNEGGYISWYEFATEIFRQAALKWPGAGYDEVSVSPVTTEEYGLSAAARPFNSRLDKSKLDKVGFERLPAWQDALSKYLDQLDLETI